MDGFINFNEFDFNNGFDENYNKFITEELILNPLYKKIKNIPESILTMFPVDNIKIELYCNKCKKRRIFTFATIGMDYYLMESGPHFSSDISINK